VRVTAASHHSCFMRLESATNTHWIGGGLPETLWIGDRIERHLLLSGNELRFPDFPFPKPSPHIG